MRLWMSAAGTTRSRVLYLTLLLAASSLSGCATMYVDNGIKDIAPVEFHHPQPSQPVQLLFTFETKGTPNGRATESLKKQVSDTVVASGVFSSVSGEPVTGGALMSIVINNVPITDNAFGKGFATGLTFGLAGNTVSDGYVCTLDFQAHPGSAKLSKVARHAIHTTVGAKGAPPNATKAPSPRDAVTTMTRQIVGNALKDLTADPAFGQ